MDSQRPSGLEEEHLLNVHEAAQLLDVTEAELWDLVHQHQVPTHNIAGAFLRFRKEDIEELKNKWRIHRELFPEKAETFSHHETVAAPTTADKFRDFWYFNDFYIICSVLIAFLAYLIVACQ